MENQPGLIVSPIELRVLGALIEKEITTPDYYPLTLNSLVAACNQKSNREPIMALGAGEAQAAVEGLCRRRLAVKEIALDGRVPKYRQSWTATVWLGEEEKAIMAELMLRGPQTLGELRGRCARMYEFASLEQVELALSGLMERTPEPLAMLLPRQAGYKERRFAQLLGGPVTVEEAPPRSSAGAGGASDFDEHPNPRPVKEEAVEELRREVVELRQELAELRQELKDFRRQFE